METNIDMESPLVFLFGNDLQIVFCPYLCCSWRIAMGEYTIGNHGILSLGSHHFSLFFAGGEPLSFYARWIPNSLAKLICFTGPMVGFMLDVLYIEAVNGGHKPANIARGHHIAQGIVQCRILQV